MEKKSKLYISVVRDKENGSWAYRGAAGRKETLDNLETLREKGIQAKDIDILPVIESRKDRIQRAATVITAVLGIIDFGVMAWKYYKKKKKARENGVRKDSGKI